MDASDYLKTPSAKPKRNITETRASVTADEVVTYLDER